MKEFKGKVAVVTGAGSGMGRAMAMRFAREGMRVVLADVEEPALAETEELIRERGGEALPVRADVSLHEDMDQLARRAVDAFGGVHVVCNNAGVGGGRGASWELTLDDWNWTLGVNLMGVVHGIRTFVPIMLRQGGEGHIVNTASLAGMITGGTGAPYSVSKFGVVALSETLYHELAAAGSSIHVSVLCPGFVSTRILDSERNRPERYPSTHDDEVTPQREAVMQAVRSMLAAGMQPPDVAERVFEAVRDERFYILTHPELNERVRQRMEAILSGENPPPSEGMRMFRESRSE
jgi:NAD(P)-dependent dehydrogenase (short-subunit alcohol dehydrogenase family)